MDQLRGLRAQGLLHHRGAVAERANRDTRGKIEITFPLLGPEIRSLAARKGDRKTAVVAENILVREIGRGRERLFHLTISVPIPFWVKISSRSECEMRPSIM